MKKLAGDLYSSRRPKVSVDGASVVCSTLIRNGIYYIIVIIIKLLMMWLWWVLELVGRYLSVRVAITRAHVTGNYTSGVYIKYNIYKYDIITAFEL